MKFGQTMNNEIQGFQLPKTVADQSAALKGISVNRVPFSSVDNDVFVVRGVL